MNDLSDLSPVKRAEADDPQHGAADPSASVWVAASAGTGKTKVLIDRVLRLLLGGTPPHRILCLTYTKAAAAEMANRIGERLGIWVRADATTLQGHLGELLRRSPDDDELARARGLFPRVLDTPGGLAIGTIHAFCQSLLGRFPLEAGVAPHAEVIDERDEVDLQAFARHAMIEAAGRGPGPLAEALATLTRHLGEGRFADLIGEMIGARDRLEAALRAAGSLPALAEQLRAALGLDAPLSPAAVVAEACADAAFDAPALRRAAEALLQGTPAEQERGRLIADWLAADPVQRGTDYPTYRCQYLTEDKTTRLLKAKERQATGNTEKAQPGTRAALAAEAERLLCVDLRWRAAGTLEATAALLEVSLEVLAHYRRLKEGRGLLDYDDLIARTGTLLAGDGLAAWVLFKLDGGIDHVLVDEAQDTSPAQWRVIKELTREFFAGEGARGLPRTVFAVGDVKQSIYSFQGADPAQFVATRDWFGSRLPRLGGMWRPLQLETSFRSTRAVLEAVDATFSRPELARSVALENIRVVHQAYRKRQGGSVEVWPPLVPRNPVEVPPWTPPTRRLPHDVAPARLARLVARRIEAMVGREELVAKGRKIRPGDVMVLLRRRSAFMLALVRALKDCGVPVAGVDRMALTEQIAVMDLVALARFALLPEDDLTLATVLKSPLIGLDDTDLLALAHGRSGRLWPALVARRAEDPRWAEAHARLARLRALVGSVPPFEFFATALAPDGADLTGGGRRRLLERLGPDADDPLAEFLDLALAYERTHPASLQGFLHWFETAAVEVKRDPEASRQNAVRVMTVHGAKGLQAPVVILPDTCQLPTRQEQVAWWVGPDAPAMPLWAPNGACCAPLVRNAQTTEKTRQVDEHRRLLYVAMTRAEDRLIVCGWLNRNQTTKGPPTESWYALIRAGLSGKQGGLTLETLEDPFLAPLRGADGMIDDATVMRLTCPQEEPCRPEAPEPGPEGAALPAWAIHPAAAETPLLQPIRPSHGGPLEPPALSPQDGPGRFLRGRLIHKLLQELPDVPARVRGDAARRWLARPTHGLSAKAQAGIAGEVLAIVGDPRWAPLFGPGSRAEAPLSGEIDGQLVTGQVDRLVVGADEVIVLDYKSDRPAPASPAGVPAAYLRQMALYRALLRRIYPTHAVRCVLLWTEKPRAMALDDALLDRWVA